MPIVRNSNLSPFQQHVQKWKNCQLCSLCNTRKHVVLARGQIPCDILLIGEAPGMSEDATGTPFIGPAGSLLDRMIVESGINRHSIAMTNVVCCFPKLTEQERLDNPKKLYRDPHADEIEACSDRLREFIVLCKPKVIVLVGEIAKKYVPKATGKLSKEPDEKAVQWFDIIHPAAILKADVTKQELLARRCVVTLEEVAAILG